MCVSRRPLCTAALAAVLALAFAGAALAADKTWKGTGDGHSWTDSAKAV